ncbi:MAG TPA: hypothetical protein VNK26_01515 [Pyrinomonadaceae bacterium]|nr:hypothetical protein [Pyrinomonadaceae bacterium]
MKENLKASEIPPGQKWDSLSVSCGENFNFLTAVCGHGWYSLPPFSFNEEKKILEYAFDAGGAAVAVRIREGKGKLKIEYTFNHVFQKSIIGPDSSNRNKRSNSKVRSGDNQSRRSAAAAKDGLDAQSNKKNENQVARKEKSSIAKSIKEKVLHILRADENLEEFYGIIARDLRFEWVKRYGAGRLLRSATIYEDAVKTICTTNCSWSLTKVMVTQLVQNLGTVVNSHYRTFPKAEAIAARSEKYMREVIRAGYRAPYLIEFSEGVASGRIKPEEWQDPEISTEELRKKLLSIKGFGPYAADHMLKLLGHYDRPAIDSWIRAKFAEKHNKGRKASDKQIEKFYSKFKKWSGLVLWCDMTEDWFCSQS